MKLQMVSENDIGQFTVVKAGTYAWRRVGLPDDIKDQAWQIGLCKEGDAFQGQYEGTGPITWITE